MPKGSLNVSLKGADDIFSTEESRQEQQREQVQQIPIGELFPFKNHPFKVLDDESMQRTVESVEQYGVLSPLIARPRPEGGYEIISGHRRQHAAQLAGLDTLPVIVRNMDDDAAVLLMVDSNVEIQKTGIKDFDRYAKRYHIDYSIQKDLSCTPPRYLVYFKAQDTDALSAAFKEYSASVLDKTKRPSVLAKLHDLAQSVANLPDKVRHKQEERGL